MNLFRFWGRRRQLEDALDSYLDARRAGKDRQAALDQLAAMPACLPSFVETIEAIKAGGRRVRLTPPSLGAPRFLPPARTRQWPAGRFGAMTQGALAWLAIVFAAYPVAILAGCVGGVFWLAWCLRLTARPQAGLCPRPE